MPEWRSATHATSIRGATKACRSGSRARATSTHRRRASADRCSSRRTTRSIAIRRFFRCPRRSSISDSALLPYVLHLADNDLILAQRLGEWVGKGPVLEEDIASANVGLDLLGQARLWFAYASEVEARADAAGRSEDELAFFRTDREFRNLLLVEQPNGN